jgi:hypothetical protein
MVNEAVRVLKKDMVKLVGSCRIGAPNPAAPAAAWPQARLIDSGDGKTVIEVTCACQEKIYIQCVY